MLDLDSHWVWDFWLADDETSYHAFFLKAPRALGDPDLRHRNATVGHAVSTDLGTWAPLTDALVPASTPAFDDLAIWTGSVLRDDGGRWRMFYTGLSRSDDGQVQRLGCAVSDDLVHWRRAAVVGVAEADPHYYEKLGDLAWPDESWRDPWIMRDHTGRWHAYVTARAGSGRGLGVVGHAVSADLETWQVGPPLSEPGGGFEWLEVISVEQVEGRWVLMFSCLAAEMVDAAPGSGGIWTVAVEGPGFQVDLRRAVRLTSEDLYVGKLVRDRFGAWQLLAFQNRDATGSFTGGLIDPIPVVWNKAGTGLALAGGHPRWRP